MSDAVTNQDVKPGTNRRQLLARAGMVGAAAIGTGMLGLGQSESAEGALPASYGIKGHKIAVNDKDILNFALNLEYLEAEFYQRAVTGSGLSTTDTGGSTGNVTGGRQVNFTTPAIANYAQEIAGDELAHVKFLRGALGKFAVPEPTIEFTKTFTALAVGAGVIPAGSTFDPFADENSFLLGSFIFEDVGVTAYHGAAAYIKNATYLGAAAGILAVEAYHAGLIRTLLVQLGSTTAPTLIDAANKISAFRDAAAKAADATNPSTDQGITNSDGSFNITPVDNNSIAFSRTFPQVLNIVYGSAAAVNKTTAPVKGGFFPQGLNGRIK